MDKQSLIERSLDLLSRCSSYIGDHEMSVVVTRLNGVDREVLCVTVRNFELGTCRVEPVALLLSDEEADALENPMTGIPGLPWIDGSCTQLALEGMDDE